MRDQPLTPDPELAAVAAALQSLKPAQSRLDRDLDMWLLRHSGRSEAESSIIFSRVDTRLNTRSLEFGNFSITPGGALEE